MARRDAADGGRTSPIDIHVGSRIRLRRTLMGMSQERLGEALGLSFQQVQKYERGVNRVSASRLFDLANVLNAPISYFFGDMPDRLTGVQAPIAGESTATAMNRRETLELVRAYYRINDPAIRERVFDLIESMSPKAT